MPRRDAEQAVRRVIRSRLDPPETLPPPGVAGREVVKHIEMLLTERQRAPGPMDLEIMLHLAARRNPVALDAAGSAAFEPQESPAHIVNLDPPPPALAVWPLGHHGHAIAHHAVDRAAQKFCRGQRMTADIGQRTTPCRVVTKGIGPLGVVHVILGMDAAIAGDLAQLACRDHLMRQRQHRIAQIVEADLRADPRRLGRLGHFQRIGGQRGQRFFAIDMLARRNRRQRYFPVQGIGRRDADKVDRGVGHDAAPVSGVAGKSVGPCCGGSSSFGHIGHGVQHQIVGQIKDARSCREPQGMGLAHEPRSDQTDAQLRLGHFI